MILPIIALTTSAFSLGYVLGVDRERRRAWRRYE
jgi:hypothetical protein